MTVEIIIQQQTALRRTPAGREIRDQALAALSMQPQKEFMQCLGCGLVVPDVGFAAGCPNCNAKDVITFNSQCTASITKEKL